MEFLDYFFNIFISVNGTFTKKNELNTVLQRARSAFCAAPSSAGPPLLIWTTATAAIHRVDCSYNAAFLSLSDCNAFIFAYFLKKAASWSLFNQ